MQGISYEAALRGYETAMVSSTGGKQLYGDGELIKINTPRAEKLAINLTTLTGGEGFFAYFSTRRMLKKARLLHWQVDSLPLSHLGSPCNIM